MGVSTTEVDKMTAITSEQVLLELRTVLTHLDELEAGEANETGVARRMVGLIVTWLYERYGIIARRGWK
jgi:hypothetical protein